LQALGLRAEAEGGGGDLYTKRSECSPSANHGRCSYPLSSGRSTGKRSTKTFTRFFAPPKLLPRKNASFEEGHDRSTKLTVRNPPPDPDYQAMMIDVVG